jgi:hypothetical protein
MNSAWNVLAAHMGTVYRFLSRFKSRAGVEPRLLGMILVFLIIWILIQFVPLQLVAFLNACGRSVRGLLVPEGCPVSPYKLTKWELWEFGAIFWSFMFCFYYFLDVKLPGSKIMHRCTMLALTLSFWVPCVILFLLIVVPQYTLARLIVTWFLSAVYLTIDFASAIFHRDRTEQTRYWESVLAADAPTVFGNTVLLAWLWKIRGSSEVEDWDRFVSGAVAFQIITCNSIFVVIQSGILEWVHRPNVSHEPADDGGAAGTDLHLDAAGGPGAETTSPGDSQPVVR